MRKYIFIFCLILGGCVTQKQVQHVLKITEINDKNTKTVQADLQNHFSQDHKIDKKVSALLDHPDKPDLKKSFIVRAIKFVSTFGGSIHPVIGVASNWILMALPFIFGTKEDDA